MAPPPRGGEQVGGARWPRRERDLGNAHSGGCVKCTFCFAFVGEFRVSAIASCLEILGPYIDAITLDLSHADIVAGQPVRVLVDGDRPLGLYLQRWDGRDDGGAPVASGTYWCRLEMPEAGFSQVRTMSLLR